MTSKTLKYETGELFYRMYGTGRPVVLVHGFGEDGTVWEKQISFLQDICLLIVPDLPGSGNSSILKEGSVEAYAKAIHAITTHEKTSPVAIIGHSMGGYVCLAYAEMFPNDISALGLFHSFASPDDEEKKEARRKGIAFIKANGSAKFLEQAIPNLFSETFRKERPEIVQQLIDRYANFNPESLVQYYEAMIRRPDRTAVLKNIKKPVLLILGERDTSIPLQRGLEQTHMPDFCYIHICKHSGHMGMLEETEKCNRAIQQFVEDL
jgi:pimeloyl-ACP methyl ester carboxylesterase